MSKKTQVDTTTLWKAIIGEIEIKSPIFRSLSNKATLNKISDNKYEIICEDTFTKRNIDSKYIDNIKMVIDKTTDTKSKLTSKVFKTTQQYEEEGMEEDTVLGPLFTQKQDQENLFREKQQRSNLTPKFTFETFVTGRNNNLAYAIAIAVAERPGEQYNPVFMYSGVGLGKTHLLQAIGNRIIQSKPGMKVIYTTGEQFTNELIESIQSGRRGKYASNEFRNKFRKADVLLIDDIQFVIGRETTQEEFFHTFNTLYMAQKQIVITSDRPPKEFTKLEDRITSRFASGIIADIQPPDLEMRIAILRNLRDKNQDTIPNDVIDFIAEKVVTNIRELEGAYMQVLTSIRSSGLDFTVDNAANILGHTIKERSSIPVNMNQILKYVCTYYSVKSTDLKGKRRTKEIVIPRQVAMYLIKDITDTPFMTIGEFLGGRDHTTIMHGVDKIGEELTKMGKLRQDIVNIKQMIFEE
ncbi:chromosomal replication initiator protein DnaA [Patescibacteria group bacterium]|nr:chromosomal replication initiator protein DnaA [Patescibacteria group bacterium]